MFCSDLSIFSRRAALSRVRRAEEGALLYPQFLWNHTVANKEGWRSFPLRVSFLAQVCLRVRSGLWLRFRFWEPFSQEGRAGHCFISVRAGQEWQQIERSGVNTPDGKWLSSKSGAGLVKMSLNIYQINVSVVLLLLLVLMGFRRGRMFQAEPLPYDWQ